MKKVLIIDDEMVGHVALIHQLEQMGATVIKAFDGATGLKFFQEHLPTVTISDTNMDFMSGPKMVEEILKVNPLAKIISCSNNPKPNLPFPPNIPFHQKPIPLEAVIKLLQ